LKQLSDHLRGRRRTRFLLDLRIPPVEKQLNRFLGDAPAWELLLRPRLAVQAIEQLQEAGIEPDVWKVDGLDRREECARVVDAARRGGRDHVGCIVLGRGKNGRAVQTALSTAAAVPGFIGFAVGRSVFWDPLVAWHAKSIAPHEAVAEVARRFQGFVDVFERAQPKQTRVA
jgi:5-dehydro-2-deoxygluconokinase